MPDNRFFVNQPLKLNQTIVITDKEAHHINVMRKQPYDSIEIINGRNQLSEGTLLTVTSKKVEVRIDTLYEETERGRECILCQALCESARLDLILQKSTELGVHEIWLFPAEKSHKKECNPHQLERMEALLIAAIKQSGRLDLPKIEWLPTLEELRTKNIPLFFGDLSAEAPLFYSCLKDQNRLCFIIGPPSGFSDQEKKLLHTLGAQGVALNSQILRTETAAIVAVALAMHIL